MYTMFYIKEPFFFSTWVPFLMCCKDFTRHQKTVCHSVFIFWTPNCKGKPEWSNFRIKGVQILQTFSFFCFWFVFYGPMRLFHSFWAHSIVRWGQKWEIPEKNHHKQNLACLTWPEQGSNTQWWDHKQFRALKISVLSHSTMGMHILNDF